MSSRMPETVRDRLNFLSFFYPKFQLKEQTVTANTNTQAPSATSNRLMGACEVAGRFPGHEPAVVYHDDDTAEYLRKLGFVVGPKRSNIYLRVWLPEGWTYRETSRIHQGDGHYIQVAMFSDRTGKLRLISILTTVGRHEGWLYGKLFIPPADKALLGDEMLENEPYNFIDARLLRNCEHWFSDFRSA